MIDPGSADDGLLLSPLRFVPYAVDVWCILLPARELRGGRIRKVTLLGVEYAVFRDSSGQIYGIEDRCPHRGIELSLGSVDAGHIRCAYHGWRIDGATAQVLRPDGSLSDQPSCLRRIALRERFGLVWGFVGDPNRAEAHPLPEIASYGEKNTVNILVRKSIAAHWSYVFDNGIDLYHYGLHADVPFFFRTLSLEDFAPVRDYFQVHYRAVMPDYLGRNREGDLVIRVASSLFRLDLGNHLRIHGLATPISADGRQLDMWWFVTIFAPAWLCPILQLIKPLLSHQVHRGFDQDVEVVESEQKAFDRGLRGQREPNRAVYGAHQYLAGLIKDSAMAMSPVIPAERLSVEAFLPDALRGELGVVWDDGERATVIDPEQEQERLRQLGNIELARYQHFVVIRP